RDTREQAAGHESETTPEQRPDNPPHTTFGNDLANDGDSSPVSQNNTPRPADPAEPSQEPPTPGTVATESTPHRPDTTGHKPGTRPKANTQERTSQNTPHPDNESNENSQQQPATDALSESGQWVNSPVISVQSSSSVPVHAAGQSTPHSIGTMSSGPVATQGPATAPQAPAVSRKGITDSVTAQRNDRPATTPHWHPPHTTSEGPSQDRNNAADQLSHKDPLPSLINSDTPTESDRYNEILAARTRTDRRTTTAPHPSDTPPNHKGGRSVEALLESDRPPREETRGPRTQQVVPSPVDKTIAKLLVSGQDPERALRRMRAAHLPQQQSLNNEDQRFYRYLVRLRDVWQRVDEIRAAQLVMAERRARMLSEHDRDAARDRLRNTGVNASMVSQFLETARRHLGAGMSLVSTVRLDAAGGGGSLLSALTASPDVAVGEVLARAA
ncbi:hypothetical protein ACFVFJ_50375, partial [Streptomyces sp. NPDC057717]